MEQNDISRKDIEKNNNDLPENLNIDQILNKIGPYISNPEYMKEFLRKHMNKTRTELVALIESELDQVDPIIRTDLRILLNSL